VRVLLILFFSINISILAIADDPGITKVRLIQQNDTTYLLEADVPQILLNTINRPVFPDRFRLTNFDYTNQSGWITLKMTISTSGPGLSPEEEILLPWLRNGIDLTAQWLDGSTYKGLFNRSLNGIHISLAEVMPTRKTTGEVLQEGFLLGLNHINFLFIHLVLIFILVWMYPGRQAFKYLLWYTFGQAFSLVFVDLWKIRVDLLFSELLVILLVLLFSYTLAYARKFRYVGIVLLLNGFFHGLSYVHELSGYELAHIQRIQSLFAFNVAIDLGHYLAALMLAWFIPYIRRYLQPEKKMGIAMGSIAILFVLLIFNQNISLGDITILNFGSSRRSVNVNIPSSGGISTGRVQRSTGIMTTPIMVYVSVEPYEVRQEILIKASEVLQLYDPEYTDIIIPVPLLDTLKSALISQVIKNSNAQINKIKEEPDDIKANFVHLSRGGVSIREKPIEENVEDAIMGITLVYDTETYPDSIQVDWQFFTNNVQEIEASVVDPHGAFTKVITPETGIIRWKNRLSGYRVPVVEAIAVKISPLPLPSIILWFVVLCIVLYLLYNKKQLNKSWIAFLLAIGFILYPFARINASIPYLTQWKPSNERTGLILNDLLTNVYRAFDRRNENDVYDRLVLSVTGEQLTDIYLQNRQVMALENRGGARAKVDEVNVMKVFDVRHGNEGAVLADAMWIVRGSVNHFGHTHYRQNQYRALVSFVNEDAVWKISSIEPIEEIRIY